MTNKKCQRINQLNTEKKETNILKVNKIKFIPQNKNLKKQLNNILFLFKKNHLLKHIQIGNLKKYLFFRAFCHLKLENYGSALEDAEACIKLDPKFSKGYYRKGSAHRALEKYKEAIEDFKTCLDFEPGI